MERDKRVAVVTDTGTSMRPESPEAKKLGVTVVPLALEFWEDGEYVLHSDAGIQPSDFYTRMEASGKMLPKTSGAVPGSFIETFRNLREKAESIISINITSKESGVWNSAVLAKNTVQEEAGPKTNIEVVDSKLVSIAAWLPVNDAADLSRQGASLSSIKDKVREVIEKTQIYVTLQTLENFIKGGRGKDLVTAIVASGLHITPVIGLVDGKLKVFERVWGSSEKARNKMIEMVGDAGELVRLAVVHTNAPALAERIKVALGKIYKGTILVYEAGPVLAVHAGQGAIGIAFQKA